MNPYDDLPNAATAPETLPALSAYNDLPDAPSGYDALPDAKAAYDNLPDAPSPQKLSAGDYVKQAVGSGVRGLTGMVSSIPEAIAIGGRGLDRLVPAFKILGESKGQESPLTKLAGGIRDVGELVAPDERPELKDSFWATDVPKGIGSALGFMLGGVAGKAAKIPATLGVAATGAAAGATEGFKDAIASGATEEQALASYLANGIVGLSEAVPLAGMLTRLNKYSGGGLAKVLREAGKETIEEALQEAFQTVAGNAIAKHLVKYDQDREIIDGLYRSAGAGGVTGLVFSLVTSAIGNLAGKRRSSGRISRGQTQGEAGVPGDSNLAPIQNATSNTRQQNFQTVYSQMDEQSRATVNRLFGKIQNGEQLAPDEQQAINSLNSYLDSMEQPGTPATISIAPEQPTTPGVTDATKNREIQANDQSQYRGTDQGLPTEGKKQEPIQVRGKQQTEIDNEITKPNFEGFKELRSIFSALDLAPDSVPTGTRTDGNLVSNQLIKWPVNDLTAISARDITPRAASRLMESIVIDLLHNEKVFRSIVPLLPVDMVNDLIGKKHPSENLLDNQSVFLDHLSSKPYSDRSIRVIRAAGELLAPSAAKLANTVGGGDLVALPAVMANEIDLGVIGRLVAMSKLNSSPGVKEAFQGAETPSAVPFKFDATGFTDILNAHASALNTQQAEKANQNKGGQVAPEPGQAVTLPQESIPTISGQLKATLRPMEISEADFNNPQEAQLLGDIQQANGKAAVSGLAPVPSGVTWKALADAGVITATPGKNGNLIIALANNFPSGNVQPNPKPKGGEQANEENRQEGQGRQEVLTPPEPAVAPGKVSLQQPPVPPSLSPKDQKALQAELDAEMGESSTVKESLQVPPAPKAKEDRARQWAEVLPDTKGMQARWEAFRSLFPNVAFRVPLAGDRGSLEVRPHPKKAGYWQSVIIRNDNEPTSSSANSHSRVMRKLAKFANVKWAEVEFLQDLTDGGSGAIVPAAVSGAETITGSNEQTGSEMPAEREQRPNRRRRNTPERTPDIIDDVEANISGKLSLASARKLREDFKPIGRLRKLFAPEGMGIDDAAQAIGLATGKQYTDEEFLDALIGAAEVRMNRRKGMAKEEEALKNEERAVLKQRAQFEEKVLKGERPKAERDNVEKVRVEALMAGDTFQVQNQSFEVESLETDEDGYLIAVTVKDGPKFGRQSITQEDKAEYIYVDKATYQPAKRPDADFLSEEDLQPEPPAAAPAPVAPAKPQFELTPRAAELLMAIARDNTDPYGPTKTKLHQDLGLEMVPGLRLQDAEEAGLLVTLVASGKATPQEWADWVAKAKASGRVNLEVKPKPQSLPKAGQELFGGEEMPFNLISDNAPPAAPKAEKPSEDLTGFGDETLAQQEMFAIQKLTNSNDPEKSANAAQELYGSPTKAVEVLRRQLEVIDSDKDTKKAFTTEQRARLKMVIQLLQERAAKPKVPVETAVAQAFPDATMAQVQLGIRAVQEADYKNFTTAGEAVRKAYMALAIQAKQADPSFSMGPFGGLEASAKLEQVVRPYGPFPSDWDFIPGVEPEPDTRYNDVLGKPGVTTEQVLNAIVLRTKNPFFRRLAQLLIDRGIFTPIQQMELQSVAPLIGRTRVPSTWQGLFDAKLDKVFVFTNAVNQENTILHELVHAATTAALQEDKAFRAEVLKIFMEATKLPGAMEQYGMANEFEFLAEAFTNPGMQKFLETPLPTKKPSLWRRLMDAIAKLFGFTKPQDQTLLQKLIEIVPAKMTPSDGSGTGAFAQDKNPSLPGLERPPGEPTPPGRVNTVIMGGIHRILDREQLTQQSRADSLAYAEQVFQATGLRVKLQQEADPRRNMLISWWEIEDTGFEQNIEGRRLAERLRQEIQREREPGKHDELLASLINSIRINFELGRMDAIFDRSVREQLYQLAQEEASHRGRMLGALAGHSIDLSFVARNVDVVLQKIYSEAFGGTAVQDLVDRVTSIFRQDPDVTGAAQGNNPELEQYIERVTEANRRDEGGRVYRRVQALLKPKRAKKLSTLEADARIQEAVKEVLQQAAGQGIEPKKVPGKPLSPLQQLLQMVAPENAAKIDALISRAVTDAEYNAGWRYLEGRPGEPDVEERKAAGEQPPPEAIEAGLELPEFAHWKAIRDNLLSYDPVTVKLAQEVIQSGFRGVKFKSAEAKPADTRIDLSKLATQPEAEVQRVINAYVENLGMSMDLARATPETRLRIQQMIYAQVDEQIKAARQRFLDNFFEPKKSLPPTTSQRLAKLINAGITKDPRFKTGPVRELISRITNTYVDGKTLRQIATLTGVAKRAWMADTMAEVSSKEGFARLEPEAREFMEAVAYTTLAERLGDVERSITNAFLKGKDANYAPKEPLTPEEKEASNEAARLKLQGLIRAGAFDVSMVDAVAGKSAVQKLTPSFKELLAKIFETPFYRQDELKQRFADVLTNSLVIDPGIAEKAWAIFERAYGKKFQEARNRALKQAREALLPEQRRAITSNRRTWQVIERLVNAGGMDTGEILRAIAQANGWAPPSDAEVAKMKSLVEQEQRLRELTPRAEEEVVKYGLDRERLLREKAAVTSGERARIKRELQTRWARMARPVKLMPGKSAWQLRQNNAAAANELAAANLLTKVGFISRQAISVISQAFVHLPTRAIAYAWVNRTNAITKGRPAEIGEFWKDVWQNVGLSLKAQKNAIRPALLNSKAAFSGRGESKNIDHLMSGMAALDRIELKAKELAAEGKHAQAAILMLYSQIKWGYRIAQALDYIHGTPAEAQELALQVDTALAEMGMERLERKQKVATVIGNATLEWADAVATVKRILDMDGIEATPEQLQEKAAALIERRQFERAREMGLAADDFETAGDYLRNTIGWNEQETRGPGGVLSRVGRGAQRVAGDMGIPLPFGAFSNAIATGINRTLHFTPFYALANTRLPGGAVEDSPWFHSEADRMQRRVEFLTGTMLGLPMLLMAASGLIVVHLRPPEDKEERELWEMQGHKAGTIEFVDSDGTFQPVSLNNSPLTPLAPYLAAGGAIYRLLTQREKQQERLDKEAAKSGLTPGKIRPLNTSDLLMVGANAAYGSIMGGSRTASGLIGSMTDYGIPNAAKIMASQVAPNIIGLPALQEISRMGGVVLDQKMAGFWDFLIPLPTSGARKLNMLGEPAGTPDDAQRIIQVLMGGTYPFKVNPNNARAIAGYAALESSGYRPPSINPNKGYLIDGEYRPMTDDELVRYTKARGENLRERLSVLGDTATEEQARAAYKEADEAALSSVGAKTIRAARSSGGGEEVGSGGGSSGGAGSGGSGSGARVGASPIRTSSARTRPAPSVPGQALRLSRGTIYSQGSNGRAPQRVPSGRGRGRVARAVGKLRGGKKVGVSRFRSTLRTGVRRLRA